MADHSGKPPVRQRVFDGRRDAWRLPNGAALTALIAGYAKEWYSTGAGALGPRRTHGPAAGQGVRMNGSQPVGKDAPEPEERSGRLSVAALRSAIAGRMWGGKGCGAPCDFCRVLVNREEIEYEVEAHLGAETLILHFHPRCYDTWRASREASADAGSGQQAPSKPVSPTRPMK